MQLNRRQRHLSLAAACRKRFQNYPKRFSKGITYSYFGNGKKQVHGVETTVAVIKA